MNVLIIEGEEEVGVEGYGGCGESRECEGIGGWCEYGGIICSYVVE